MKFGAVEMVLWLTALAATVEDLGLSFWHPGEVALKLPATLVLRDPTLFPGLFRYQNTHNAHVSKQAHMKKKKREKTLSWVGREVRVDLGEIVGRVEYDQFTLHEILKTIMLRNFK